MEKVRGISAGECLRGTITVPGDKSISHRAVMLGAIAEGTTEITGFLPGADCLSTIDCFRRLGVEIFQDGGYVRVEGVGLHGLREPSDILDAGNSGTTIRLISGILSGQPFTATLTGDASIRRRPMKRVLAPLTQMGATVLGREDDSKAPFSIRGGQLTPIIYKTPVASAQIKSAILLAGLYAPGQTTVIEPEKSRNHSEVMLRGFGAQVTEDAHSSTIIGLPTLRGQQICIPGDISSAAFFLVAASILPGSDLLIQNVGINQTRTGILDVLSMMGADITIENPRETSGEKVADLRVRAAALKGVEFGGEIIPRLVDEIPILAVAAVFATGTTIIRDAQELKVKESNRLETITTELRRMGAEIQETPDGLIIQGMGGRSGAGQTADDRGAEDGGATDRGADDAGAPEAFLQAAVCESYHDHRIAMSCAVAALRARGTTEIRDPESVDVSFPGFFSLLEGIRQ